MLSLVSFLCKRVKKHKQKGSKEIKNLLVLSAVLVIIGVGCFCASEALGNKLHVNLTAVLVSIMILGGICYNEAISLNVDDTE